VCVCRLSYPACNAHKPHYIVICGLAGCTIFFHIVSQRYDFQGKKVIELKMRVLLFFATFVSNIPRCKKNCASYNQTVYCSSCKVPVILVAFYWNLNFLDRFSKNTQIPYFYEILSSGSRVVPRGRAHGRTDRQTWLKPTVAFRNSANAPIKQRKSGLMSVLWMSFEHVMSVRAIDALNAWPLYYVTALCYTVYIYTQKHFPLPQTHTQ
jgi:hypothetical protein